jgi:signal peptidase II
MKGKLLNLAAWLGMTAVCVAADQYTKSMIVKHLAGKEPIVLIHGVFEILYTENRGAAFGMLQGKQGFFFVIALIVLAAAAWVMVRLPDFSEKRYHLLKLCVAWITAGAVGNMIDRLSQGYVVDFLYFKLIDFPVFNVADIFVTCATALLMVLLLFYYKDEDLECLRFRKSGKGDGK